MLQISQRLLFMRLPQLKNFFFETLESCYGNQDLKVKICIAGDLLRLNFTFLGWGGQLNANGNSIISVAEEPV